VFFNEGWVPYNERANFLLDADLGVSTHLDHLETAFSFRTRILDYLWAGLPIVATKGDTFEPVIEENMLGRTVPPGDINSLAEAMEELLYNEQVSQDARMKVRNYSAVLQWDLVLQPLIEFVLASKHAADHKSGFSQGITTLGHVGRRTLRQRLFMYSLSVQKNGFRYSTDLFVKNLFGKSFRKFKRIFQQV
jgi:hypothetical protein